MINDIGHLDEWPPGPVRTAGLTGLARDLVAERARTRRSRDRGDTLVDLAGELGRTGVGAEITVQEGGDRWSMTVFPRPVGEDPSA